MHRQGGALVLRKESKPEALGKPWAALSLRREIAFLRDLPAASQADFPSLLRHWESEDSLGYEIPYHEDCPDLARLILSGKLSQTEADQMQEELADAIFLRLHQPIQPRESLAKHVAETMFSVLERLADIPEFAELVNSRSVVINGRSWPGVRTLVEAVLAQNSLAELDGIAVRLHGDLILENVLRCPGTRLLLIDPVSVAAVDAGHPLFDLVKYESHASGELHAFRKELLDAGPIANGYELRVWTESADIRAFSSLDLAGRFRQRYVQTYRPVNPWLYAVLEAYFALVMAVNTSGKQQWARVLKGIMSLGRAIS